MHTIKKEPANADSDQNKYITTSDVVKEVEKFIEQISIFEDNELGIETYDYVALDDLFRLYFHDVDKFYQSSEGYFVSIRKTLMDESTHEAYFYDNNIKFYILLTEKEFTNLKKLLSEDEYEFVGDEHVAT